MSNVSNLIYYLDNPAHLPVLQAHFDAPGMKSRTGEYGLHNSSCPRAGALIFLKYDVYFKPGINVFSVLAHV
jgi:hypothetical protein